MSPKPPPRPGRTPPGSPDPVEPRGPRRPPPRRRGDAPPATAGPAAPVRRDGTDAPRSGRRPPGTSREGTSRKATGADSPPVPPSRGGAAKPALPGPRPDRATRPAPRSATTTSASSATGPVTSSVRFKDADRTRTARAATEPSTTTSTPAGGASAPATARTKAARKPRPDPAELLPPPTTPRTAFRQRYGVVYDTQGPRIRIGLLWAASVALALAVRPLRPYGLATLYAVVAGVAAMQVVDAWHAVRRGADRWVAALGASTLPMLATLGVGPLGVGLLVLVAGALGVAAVRQDRHMSLVAAAGHTVLSAGLCGLAAASMVLLADYEIGAVIILVVIVMVYDASDYVVGSGADNGFEGPLAGALSIAAVTALFAVTNAPPFRGADIWTFSVLAAIACPAGQILASAMLPTASVRAPALRRLDSWLIAAPAWAGLVGLYLQRAA